MNYGKIVKEVKYCLQLQKVINMDEQELRRCAICNQILDHCHSHGEKDFCLELLKKLKSNEIDNAEFISKLGEKINVDKMMNTIIPHNEAG